MNTKERSTRIRWWLMVAFTIVVSSERSGMAAEGQNPVFTTVASVRSLSAAEAAQGHPVKLRGVVTFSDEALFSRFIQDETAGIYLVELTNAPVLLPGQVVEVEGTTGPGEYAPVVVPQSIKVVGEAELPAAKPVSWEELVSGHQDGQFVEFSGIVRAVHFDETSQYHLLDFAKGDERFTVYAKQLPAEKAENLVESKVKVRGVSATMFNHQRQLFGIRLLTPTPDGIQLEQAAPADPFDQPARNINSLLQFAPQGTLGGRVKVSGTVVSWEPGKSIVVQDQEAGLYCQTMQRDPVEPGDQVEILGFPSRGEYTPVLEDAVYRKVGTGDEPEPDRVDVNQILTGMHDCRLVQLPAKVLARVDRGVNQFLLLQAGDLTFQAYLPPRVSSATSAGLEPGCEVMATGVCRIERGDQWQAGNQWRAASFHLLLRSPEDVAILQRPTELTPPDGIWVAVASGIVAVGAMAWVVVLRRKIRLQSRLFQGK